MFSITKTTSFLAAPLLALSLLTSCSLRIPVKTSPKPQRIKVSSHAAPDKPERAPHVLVWLMADTYHTGMVFPYDWLVESGFVPPEGFGHPRYVAMSWGNRNAYSQDGIDNAWKMFRVLFTPTPSVMELIEVNWDVAEVCPHQRIWRKIVPREHGPAIAAFLNKCSKTDSNGRPIVVCPSSWGKGVQLEGRYPYFIPRVCNVWTVQTIENMGGDINPWFALTADGLVRQAEKPPNDFELIWPGNGEKP